jgi:hypothetical protein
MPRDYKVYLEDILLAIGKIPEYTTGISQEVFTKDSKTLDATAPHSPAKPRSALGESRYSSPKAFSTSSRLVLVSSQASGSVERRA